MSSAAERKNRLVVGPPSQGSPSTDFVRGYVVVATLLFLILTAGFLVVGFRLSRDQLSGNLSLFFSGAIALTTVMYATATLLQLRQTVEASRMSASLMVRLHADSLSPILDVSSVSITHFVSSTRLPRLNVSSIDVSDDGVLLNGNAHLFSEARIGVRVKVNLRNASNNSADVEAIIFVQTAEPVGGCEGHVQEYDSAGRAVWKGEMPPVRLMLLPLQQQVIRTESRESDANPYWGLAGRMVRVVIQLQGKGPGMGASEGLIVMTHDFPLRLGDCTFSAGSLVLVERERSYGV